MIEQFVKFCIYTMNISRNQLDISNISWIESLNTNSGAITAVSTIILAVITLIYTVLVFKTLKETIKVRQIESIEKKLQKLYYPLKDTIGPAIYWIVHHRDEEKLDNSIDSVITKLDELKIHKHLYSKELNKLIQEFIQVHYKHHLENEDFDRLISLMTKMQEYVNRDIDVYQNKLDKIVL